MSKTVSERINFATTLGIQWEESPCDGCGVVTMPLEEKHQNKFKTAHGGAIFTLADMAFAAACRSLGISAVTSQSSISYLAPGVVSPLRAEATPVKIGRHLAIFDVLVSDGSGRAVAKAVITGYIQGPLDDFCFDELEAGHEN
jgi:acyl-CoA thioesterase